MLTMSRLLSAVLLALPGSALATTLIVDVHVVPMDEEHVLRDYAVVIEDDRIKKVVAMDALDRSAYSDASIIDGESRYLMPGLAEMHGHVPPMQSNNYPERYLDDTLFLYLAGGITTVRGMLGHPGQLELKEDIRRGDRQGPNLYLAGPGFSGNSVSSPEQAREMVREHAQAGWDLLKVHPGLELEEFEAMAEEANEQGIDFAGHIPGSVPLARAKELGIRTIDHIDGYMESIAATDRRATDEELHVLAQHTLEAGVGIVPTQALWETLMGAADPDELAQYEEIKYMPRSVREGWSNAMENISSFGQYSGDAAGIHAQNRQRLLLIMHQEGVEILMGTDAPQYYSVPGLGLKHELALMEEAGLTPYEVLRTGTVNVGRYFADEDTFGMVAEGHRADLILLDANPLEDLTTISSPQGVMIRGQWLDRDTLDATLADIEAAYR